MRKYDFYNDPGHGWLKVKRQELVELGIETQISGYSYQKGDAVYLEEDSDAPKFMRAWEAKHKILLTPRVNFIYVDRRSRIRTYQPFSPQAHSTSCGDPAADPKLQEQNRNEVQHQLMGVDGWQETYSDAPSEQDIKQEMADDADKERKEQSL